MTAERWVQLCAFAIGGRAYALDIARVEEILPARPSTPWPGAPGHIRGVLDVRGEVVPVVDARARLGLPAAPSPGRERLLVARVGGLRVALVVDEVQGVVRIGRDALRPPPSAAAPSPYVLGVCGEPDALRLLLDLRALIAEPRP